MEEDGAVVASRQLSAEARGVLGLSEPMRVKGLAEGHRVYLPWHRSKVFKG